MPSRSAALSRTRRVASSASAAIHAVEERRGGGFAKPFFLLRRRRPSCSAPSPASQAPRSARARASTGIPVSGTRGYHGECLQNELASFVQRVIRVVREDARFLKLAHAAGDASSVRPRLGFRARPLRQSLRGLEPQVRLGHLAESLQDVPEHVVALGVVRAQTHGFPRGDQRLRVLREIFGLAHRQHHQALGVRGVDAHRARSRRARRSPPRACTKYRRRCSGPSRPRCRRDARRRARRRRSRRTSRGRRRRRRARASGARPGPWRRARPRGGQPSPPPRTRSAPPPEPRWARRRPSERTGRPSSRAPLSQSTASSRWKKKGVFWEPMSASAVCKKRGREKRKGELGVSRRGTSAARAVARRAPPRAERLEVGKDAQCPARPRDTPGGTPEARTRPRDRSRAFGTSPGTPPRAIPATRPRGSTTPDTLTSGSPAPRVRPRRVSRRLPRRPTGAGPRGRAREGRRAGPRRGTRGAHPAPRVPHQGPGGTRPSPAGPYPGPPVPLEASRCAARLPNPRARAGARPARSRGTAVPGTSPGTAVRRVSGCSRGAVGYVRAAPPSERDGRDCSRGRPPRTTSCTSPRATRASKEKLSKALAKNRSMAKYYDQLLAKTRDAQERETDGLKGGMRLRA